MLFQFPYGSQAVNHIPGKPANGFCQDNIDLPHFTVGQHPLKPAAIFHPRYPAVRVHPCILPLGIVTDTRSIMAYLHEKGMHKLPLFPLKRHRPCRLDPAYIPQ